MTSRQPAHGSAASDGTSAEQTVAMMWYLRVFVSVASKFVRDVSRPSCGLELPHFKLCPSTCGHLRCLARAGLRVPRLYPCYVVVRLTATHSWIWFVLFAVLTTCGTRTHRACRTGTATNQSPLASSRPGGPVSFATPTLPPPHVSPDTVPTPALRPPVGLVTNNIPHTFRVASATWRACVFL
jgi:hypothetical protein